MACLRVVLVFAAKMITNTGCPQTVQQTCNKFQFGADIMQLAIILSSVMQAARNSGFTFGVQLKPEGLVSFPTEYLQHKSLSQLPEDAAQHISYALAYSPEGQNTFGR